MKMRSKLFLTYLLLSFLSLSIAGILIFSSVKKRSLLELEQSMLSQTQLLSYIFALPLVDSLGIEATDSLADQLGRKIPGRITIIAKDGKVVADSYLSGSDLLQMENHKDRPEVAPAFRGEAHRSIRFSHTIKTDMLYVASPIKARGEIVGVARLALPLTDLKQHQNMIIYIVLIGLLVAFVFSLLLSFGFSSTVTKPLRRMMLAGRRISRGDFRQQIEIKTKDDPDNR
jgi:two-component system phosphate regulon sensor histidine kinase PhoR